MPKLMYEQAEADLVTAKGRELMQAWLAQHMPEAELTDCAAYIAMPLSDGNEYLTDYAQGYIRNDEKNTEFMVNTVSGAVYLGPDAQTQTKLNEAAEAFIEEITGLIADENHSFLCTTMVPGRIGLAYTCCRLVRIRRISMPLSVIRRPVRCWKFMVIFCCRRVPI